MLVAAMAPSRRQVLQFSLAAAVPAISAASVPVGAHVWVFAASQPNYDPTPVIEEIFRQYSRTGIDGVELMHPVLLNGDPVERIRELSRRYSLPVMGTSWSAAMWDASQSSAVLDQARTLLPRLASVGGRTLGISVGDARRKKTEAEFDTQAAVLRQVLAMCADHGIAANLHNHTYEVRDNEYDLRGTLARVPGAKLGPDLNWLIRAGVDPVDFLWRYRDRVIFAHLRDQNRDGTWSEAMGEGSTDFAAIGAMLHKIDFHGHLVIELAHEKTFRPARSYGESVRISREFIRKTMNY